MTRILMVLLALVVGVAGAHAQESFGALSEFLPAPGTPDPIWQFHRDPDTFQLVNASDGNAITYFYTDAAAGPGSKRRIETEVTLETMPDQHGFAGLIYGFNPEDRSYYLFVLEPGSRATLYRRDTEGFRPVMERTSGSIQAQRNVLAIEESGQTIKLIVNGQEFAEIGNDTVGRGGVGIAAGGIVRATFTAFSLTKSTTSLVPLYQTNGISPVEVF